jgi:hypothetical protein
MRWLPSGGKPGLSKGARVAFLVATAASVVGCGEGPFGVSADTAYVLTRVNGAALPVVLVSDQTSVLRLVADTLLFSGSGRFERIRWMSEQPQGSGVLTMTRDSSSGVVIPVKRGFVLVSDVCMDPRALALCVAPDTARSHSGGLELRGPVPPAGVKRFDER